MPSFIAGVFFGAATMFAAIWSARYFRVDSVMERAADFSTSPVQIIEQDEAQNVTAFEDAKNSDKDLTIDEII